MIFNLLVFLYIPLKKFTIHITFYFTYKYFTILPELYHGEQKTITTPWRLKKVKNCIQYYKITTIQKRETKGKFYFKR